MAQTDRRLSSMVRSGTKPVAWTCLPVRCRADAVSMEAAAAAACGVSCSAVNPNPEPDWSGAHKGLAVYISRLLAPIWEAKLITPSASNANVWKARLSERSMTVRGWWLLRRQRPMML